MLKFVGGKQMLKIFTCVGGGRKHEKFRGSGRLWGTATPAPSKNFDHAHTGCPIKKVSIKNF